MDFKQQLTVEPQKYWQPPKGNPLVSMILAEPEKYTHYTFTPKMDGEWKKRSSYQKNKSLQIRFLISSSS